MVFFRRENCVLHGVYLHLEYWNTPKSLCSIWQCFSSLLDEEIAKICKKLNSHDGYLSCTCKIGQPNQPIWWQSFALSWSVLKMPLWGLNFLHILEIPSSSRHEKRCQMLKRHVWVLKYSRKHLHSYQQFQILKDFLTGHECNCSLYQNFNIPQELLLVHES